jgi:hypothetical protein
MERGLFFTTARSREHPQLTAVSYQSALHRTTLGRGAVRDRSEKPWGIAPAGDVTATSSLCDRRLTVSGGCGHLLRWQRLSWQARKCCPHASITHLCAGDLLQSRIVPPVRSAVTATLRVLCEGRRGWREGNESAGRYLVKRVRRVAIGGRTCLSAPSPGKPLADPPAQTD